MSEDRPLTIEEALAQVRELLQRLDGRDKVALELVIRVADRSRRVSSSTTIPTVTGVAARSAEHFAKARSEIERAREQALPAKRRSRPPGK